MFVWEFIVTLTILRHDVELLMILYALTYLVESEGIDISSYVLFQEADNIPLRKMNRAANHLLLARNSKNLSPEGLKMRKPNQPSEPAKVK